MTKSSNSNTSSSSNQKIVIAVSGFGTGETLDGEKETIKYNVKALIDKFNKEDKKKSKSYFLEDDSPLDAICTHVISNSSSSKRSLRILFAIVRGIPIVTEAWVYACIENNDWISLDHTNSELRHARFNQLPLGSNLSIFNDLSFYVGYSSDPKKEEVNKLILWAGGTIADKIVDADYLIFGNKSDSVTWCYGQTLASDVFKHIEDLASENKIVNTKFIFDCIEDNQLKRPYKKLHVMTIPIEKIPITTINSKEYHNYLNTEISDNEIRKERNKIIYCKDTINNNQILSNSQELMSEIALNSLVDSSNIVNNDEIYSNINDNDNIKEIKKIKEVNNKKTKKQPVTMNKDIDDNKSAKKIKLNSTINNDITYLLNSSISPKAVEVSNINTTITNNEDPVKISLSLDITSSPIFSASSSNLQASPISIGSVQKDNIIISPNIDVNTPSELNNSTTPGTVIRTLHDSDNDDNQIHDGNNEETDDGGDGERDDKAYNKIINNNIFKQVCEENGENKEESLTDEDSPLKNFIVFIGKITPYKFTKQVSASIEICGGIICTKVLEANNIVFGTYNDAIEWLDESNLSIEEKNHVYNLSINGKLITRQFVKDCNDNLELVKYNMEIHTIRLNNDREYISNIQVNKNNSNNNQNFSDDDEWDEESTSPIIPNKKRKSRLIKNNDNKGKILDVKINQKEDSDEDNFYDQDQQHEPNDTLIENSEDQIHSPDW